jgi:hypothetical protein
MSANINLVVRRAGRKDLRAHKGEEPNPVVRAVSARGSILGVTFHHRARQEGPSYNTGPNEFCCVFIFDLVTCLLRVNPLVTRSLFFSARET